MLHQIVFILTQVVMSSCCGGAQWSLLAVAVLGTQAEENRAECLARVATAYAIRKARAEVLGAVMATSAWLGVFGKTVQANAVD